MARDVSSASGSVAAGDLHAVLSQCLDRTRRSLEARLADASGGELLREYFGRGKMLRAYLVFAASAAVGGRPEDVVMAAEAIELLHGASLFHDDIIDGAGERRGMTALHERIGIGPALVLGDELILRAFAVLQEAHTNHAGPRVLEATDALNSLARECCRGQFEELSADGWISEDEYLAIVSRKTASAFVAAGVLGAVLGGATRSNLGRIEVYARQMGIAFQIGDDLLDLIGEPSLLGKPVGNSLAQGRPMLPLIYLWQKSSDVERANLSRLEAGSCLRALLARHDIVEQVRQRQQQYLGAAVAALEGLPGPGGVAALRTLAARAAVRVDLGDVEGRGSQRS
jgi:geranylgeranyl pyrophosphate synthase